MWVRLLGSSSSSITSQVQFLFIDGSVKLNLNSSNIQQWSRHKIPTSSYSKKKHEVQGMWELLVHENSEIQLGKCSSASFRPGNNPSWFLILPFGVLSYPSYSWRVVCVYIWVFSACFLPVESWGFMVFFHLGPFPFLLVKTGSVSPDKILSKLLWVSHEAYWGLLLLVKKHTHLRDDSFSTLGFCKNKGETTPFNLAKSCWENLC